MTIIAALKTETGVILGCDRLSTRSGYLKHYTETKWTKLGTFWVGLAGDARARTLVMHRGNEFMGQTPFAAMEFIKKLIIDDGWKGEEKPREGSAYGLEGIITDGREIVEFGGTFVMLEAQDGLGLAGCGEEVARGVFFALNSILSDRREIVRRMIEICGEVQRDCGGTPWIIEITTEGKPNGQEEKVTVTGRGITGGKPADEALIGGFRANLFLHGTYPEL